MQLQEIRANLGASRPPAEVAADLTPAAVLMPLLVKDGTLHVLFIKRSQRVKAHKGQISFPGGVQDPEDVDLRATALREAREEIGLRPQDVELLGALAPVTTVTSGFQVFTFVGHIPYPYDFQPQRREVDDIILVPLAALADSRRWQRRTFHRDGHRFNAYFITYDSHRIWGATARILKMFLERNRVELQVEPIVLY